MTLITIDTTAGTVTVDGTIPYGHHVAPYRVTLATRGEPAKVERLNSGSFDAEDVAAVFRDVLLELTPFLLSERVRGDELEAELRALDDAPPDSEPADPTMAVVEEILAKVGTLDGSMLSRHGLRIEAAAADSQDLDKRRAGRVAQCAENVYQILGLDRIAAALADEPTEEMIANPRRVAEELAIDANTLSVAMDNVVEAVEAHVAAHAIDAETTAS